MIFNPNLAEIAEKYLRKGSKVMVEGELRTRKWTDSQNIERYTTEIVLGKFDGKLILLDAAGERPAASGNGAGGYDAPPPSEEPPPPAPGDSGMELVD